MTKKIFGFLAIFALSGLFFQTNVWVSEVHAQSLQVAPTTTPIVDTMDVVSLLDLVLKVIYILLWPLIVICGWALDNTLVYGAVFHLDVPLWKFRNIMKNFANFTLGFMVLFAILKSFFTKEWVGDLKDGKTPLWIIKKTLIAGILIQASWFLLAATIDLSTVTTYAVGWLPLTVIKSTELGKKKILSTDTKIDVSRYQNIGWVGKIFTVNYSAGPYKLSSCQLSNNWLSWWEYRYIVWRTQMSGTEVGRCVLAGNMVMNFDETGLITYFDGSGIPGGYTSYLLWFFNIPPADVDRLIAEDKIIDIYSWNSFIKSKNSGSGWFASTPAMMLSDLVTKSKWFVGPLVTIYSSLLNFAEISDTGVDSYGKMGWEMIIRAAFAIMLFFPLLALAVVLIARVGFLRLVIATSPFIILMEVFKDSIKIWENLGELGKQLELKNIISVIFAPVVTVFALSLALIFITTLINTLTPKEWPNPQDTSVSSALAPQVQKLPSNGNSQKYSILGAELELVNFNRWGTLDRFSRLIINLISVWLMWALLFAAIKANSLGKSIAAPIEKFGGNFMSTLPIFSVPGGTEKVGLGSIARVATNTPNDIYMANRMRKQEAIGAQFAEAKFGDGSDKTPPITEPEYTTIANQFKKDSDIAAGFTTINDTRKVWETIDQSTAIADAATWSKLNTIITGWTTGTDRDTALKNAWDSRWKEVFEKNLAAGTYTDATAIETALNVNDITRKYAEGKVGEITAKDNKKYTVTKVTTWTPTTFKVVLKTP